MNNLFEIKKMIQAVIENKDFIGIIIAFLGVVIPLAIFLISKSKEQRQINFEKFHKEVISGLSNQYKNVGLDQQIAIIFELRNFPEYFPVTKRILIDLKNFWKLSVLDEESLRRLNKEADETINYMNKCIICRFFVRVKDRIKI